MAKRESFKELEPEAPGLLKQIKWLLLYGRKYWKLLLIALIVIAANPLYKIAKGYYSSPRMPIPLGDFKIAFINHLSDTVTIDNPGELYIHAPETPGTNREVSSGLMELQFAKHQYFLKIAPHDSVSISAEIFNEPRFLQYIDAGEFFCLIIFSARPRPIHTEILFRRKTFKDGIEFIVDSSNKRETTIRATK